MRGFNREKGRREKSEDELVTAFKEGGCGRGEGHGNRDVREVGKALHETAVEVLGH